MCSRITAISTAGKNFLGEKILPSLVCLTITLFASFFFPLLSSFFSFFLFSFILYTFFFFFCCVLLFFPFFFWSYTRPLSLWRVPLFFGTLPRFACVGAYVSIVCLLNSITATRHASFAETPLPRKLGCGY